MPARDEGEGVRSGWEIEPPFIWFTCAGSLHVSRDARVGLHTQNA